MARPLVETRKLNNAASARSKLKRKYGLTEAGYETMLRGQNGVCAICAGTQKQRLSVDHCHTTGRVRALLCKKCNSGLGLFRDEVAILEQALTYLKGHQ